MKRATDDARSPHRYKRSVDARREAVSAESDAAVDVRIVAREVDSTAIASITAAGFCDVAAESR